MGSSKKITKARLKSLYEQHSITEIAAELGVARSTVFSYLKKYGIKTRSRSDAQLKNIENNGHSRLGQKHSEISKENISDSCGNFWSSHDGEIAKSDLSIQRKTEWKLKTKEDKTAKLNQLVNSKNTGHKSKLCIALEAFLKDQKEDISVRKELTTGHLSDIILHERRVVVELVLPVNVFGKDQGQKLVRRYEELCREINALGYKTLIVEDMSNSVSRARCKSIYEQVDKLSKSKTLNKHIIS